MTGPERIRRGLYWDRSWNPFTGCSPVGMGCDNCWARRTAETRLKGQYGYPADDPFRPTFHPERLKQVNPKQKPQVIAACFMSDPFHEEHQKRDVLRMITKIFECPQHTFIALTKRPEIMQTFLGESGPLIPNLVGGVSVWDQPSADRMIPILLETNLATRIVSLEPLLAPVKLSQSHIDYLVGWDTEAEHGRHDKYGNCIDCPIPAQVQTEKIDQLIIGCESGPHRRKTELEWVYDLVDQAKDAGVAIFIKQLEIDGRVEHDMTKFPPDLQIREMP